ncbi:MAG: carboxypeptidase-like regulatory domain-containing protein [Candidatus Sericytochromatia bacterium]|nr:carboxypeptidase-like regulatory domain-containing protein [Candidatus Sericytochromatia bacterium]
MAFIRTHVAAAFAGTLSLVALTGCPGVAPTGTSPTGAPSAPASAAVQPSAVAASATPAAAPGDAAPSAAPSAVISAPPATGKVIVLSGMVYDEAGAAVEGATVTVTSLDAAVPYGATVKTTAGSYVVNDVPEGANVEVVVTKPGWTTRRRVGSFQQRATGEKNTMDFGYTGVRQPLLGYTLHQVQAEPLPDGAAYFISDYPEIAATTPEHDARGLDPSKLAIKVTLSEPLDADSRDAFDDAFHVVPANAQAATLHDDVAGRETTANDGLDDGASGDRIASFTYTLNAGDTFLGSSRNRVRATWNAEGTEVTYTFEGGNLQTDDSEPAAYQAMLFAGAEKIEDADGHQLGTNSAGAFQWPAAGQPLYNVFKDTELALTPYGNVFYRLAAVAADPRWGETHQTAVAFEFNEDETDPRLTDVSFIEDDNDARLALTFSEPLAAYAGSGRATINPALYELANYSFMVGARAGDLDGEQLDGGITVIAAKDLDAGLPTFTAEQEFGFKALTSIGDHAGPRLNDVATNTLHGVGKDLEAASEATVAIEVDPELPNTVNIWIRNGRSMFDGFRSIKARVEGVTDPAGNAIRRTDADQNLAGATL